MNAQITNELVDFHRFVGEKAMNGSAHLSPEEVLDEWRMQHPPPLDEDDIAAIQEALDDIENGEVGMPIEEFEREFRATHNLPPRR